LRYEAGLAVGSSYKIRAPLSRREDGSINFSCGIPEGSIIRITESVPERQISSAREAASRARVRLAGAPVAGALVFDCICRNSDSSAEQFNEAVRGISDELGGVPLAGFETYGEIALDAGDMSGFHNTTTWCWPPGLMPSPRISRHTMVRCELAITLLEPTLGWEKSVEVIETTSKDLGLPRATSPCFQMLRVFEKLGERNDLGGCRGPFCRMRLEGNVSPD